HASQAEADGQAQSSDFATESEKAESESGQSGAVEATPQELDNEFKKLEQVELARDPSQLLKAQFLLQAKHKNPPKESTKQW
ncbi:MAG TPA: hypothetical protein DCS35_01690, partial [Vibrio sp.]|nr:hypothetical protein [Vibrio sp.]